MPNRAALLGSLVSLVVGSASMVLAQTPELKEGDAAPAFELPGTDGRTHRLADYRGRTVVLAWFPKAFTAG